MCYWSNNIIYDPSSNKYVNAQPLPQALVNVNVFAINNPQSYMVNALYTVGSLPNSFYWKIYLLYDTWKEQQNTNYRRKDFAMAAWKERLYMIGGMGDAICPADIEYSTTYFDTTFERWTSSPDMLVQRESPRSAVIGNSIYVCGGTTYIGDRSSCTKGETASCERLTLNDDGSVNKTWELIAPMNNARDNFTLVSYNNKLYAFVSYANPYTMEVYDPTHNNWAQTNIPDPKDIYGNAATVINDFPTSDIIECSTTSDFKTNVFKTQSAGDSFINCDGTSNSGSSINRFSFAILFFFLLLQLLVFEI